MTPSPSRPLCTCLIKQPIAQDDYISGWGMQVCLHCNGFIEWGTGRVDVKTGAKLN